MAEFPSMPLYTDAYLGDTQHLTLEEHGAYLKLLIIAWRTADCSLPADDKRLATMLGITPKKWGKLKPAIVDFFDEREGKYKQKKLTKVRRAVEESREQKRYAGEASAKARALKNNNSCPTDVITNVSTEHPTERQQTKTNTITSKNLTVREGGSRGEKTKRRKTPIPTDWKPNPKSYEIGKAEGYSADETNWIAHQFRDSASANGRTYQDWDRAFYNWIRSGITRTDVNRRRNGSGTGNRPGQGVSEHDQAIENLRREITGEADIH